MGAPRAICSANPWSAIYLAEGLDAFGLSWDDERTTPVG